MVSGPLSSFAVFSGSAVFSGFGDSGFAGAADASGDAMGDAAGAADVAGAVEASDDTAGAAEASGDVVDGDAAGDGEAASTGMLIASRATPAADAMPTRRFDAFMLASSPWNLASDRAMERRDASSGARLHQNLDRYVTRVMGGVSPPADRDEGPLASARVT